MESTKPPNPARVDPWVQPTAARQVERPARPALAHVRSEWLADRWSEDLLAQFSLRMACHGMSISRTHMRSDPLYAQQQLGHALGMDDPALHALATCLASAVGADATAQRFTTH